MNTQNKIIPFSREEVGTLRTAIDEKGRVVFCLVDACKILDIKNHRDAKTRLRKDGLVDMSISESKRKIVFITEPNLYRLILQSRKEEAAKFTDWIVEEVLPSLRVTGNYSVTNILQSKDSSIAFLEDYNSLLLENRLLKEIQQESKEAREYLKRTVRSYSLVDLVDLPAVLKMQGVAFTDITKVLRDKGVLDSNNIPFDEYVDKKWFRVDTHTFKQDKALVVIKRVLLYKSGVTCVRKLILESRGIKNG